MSAPTSTMRRVVIADACADVRNVGSLIGVVSAVNTNLCALITDVGVQVDDTYRRIAHECLDIRYSWTAMLSLTAIIPMMTPVIGVLTVLVTSYERLIGESCAPVADRLAVIAPLCVVHPIR